ncbi:MAG: bacterial Ig-like domain-containing protein [Acholeplasmatales bacterium]|nr:bacterial Ig-like domain-containing protein [Acholeplasmatales bacterium]
MRKFSKFFCAFTGLSLVAALASCGGNNQPTTASTAPITTSPVQTISETDEKYPTVSADGVSAEAGKLIQIFADTTNAKKVFYVGDTFSSEGLVVKATYYNETTSQRTTKEVTGYTLDASGFNSDAVGSSQILVSYREGGEVVNTYYTVQIKLSLFESTQDITFVSGLDVEFNTAVSTDKLVKTIDLNTNYAFAKSNLKYKLYTTTTSAEGNTVAVEDITSRDVEIEQAINVNKVGVYMVKVTYTGNNVTIGGKTYENKVTAFVLVNVVNPVTAIQKVSTGDTTFEATPDKLDLSNWEIKITRKVNAGEEIVHFNDKDFVLSGVNLLVVGEQTASIVYKELAENGTTIMCEVPVTVNESSKYDILINDNIETLAKAGTPAADGAPTPYTFEGEELDFLTAQNIGIQLEKKRSSDGLEFSGFIKVDGAAKKSFVKIHMEKGGKLVLFVSSNGDDARTCILENEELEYEEKRTTPDGSTYKQQPQRFEYVLEAGDYLFYAEGGTVNIHGFILATEK